ncbi:MAG: hypothetical protein PWQ12_1391 [Clostridiales bacterium]|jgi:two-component system NarL family response regulator|nr:hypothetical protein [Clostridiales bacterium]
MALKVLLIDDHPLFAKGLTYLLKTRGIDVVAAVTEPRQAFEEVKKLRPEIVLLDIMMPDLSGLDVLKLIKAELPETKVAMLTASEDDDHLFEAIRIGASGYLLKNLSDTALTEMIEGLSRGEVMLSPELAEKLFNEFQKEKKAAESKTFDQQDTAKAPNGEMSHLTKRQREVLELVALGRTYRETGDALGLTERTVKYHMGRIIEIMHMENRAQVIAYAARSGLSGDR